MIAATNPNLERVVGDGRFREDPYYPFNVLHLDMIPQRERGEDIFLMADHLLRQFATTMKPNIRDFSGQALATIAAYPWPRNIREMVNRIQRAVVMC